MKESGINYFVGDLGINTGNLAVFYTFEEGSGSFLTSISGGQSVYGATLNNTTNFWSQPNSGFFSGNYAQISGASGAYSLSWTQVFAYQKVDTQPLVLFNSLTGASGWRVGVTQANRPYLESFNTQPVMAASENNFSSKVLLTVTYMPNFVTMGYYNFNAKTLETETFDFPFQIAQSDDWKLGGTTGYMDYFIHFTQAQSSDVLGQLCSGFFAYPTGTSYATQDFVTTGITGYQDVVVFETGITGYSITPGGDQGRDYYTGAFPTYFTESALTGFLSTGLYSSGVSGNLTYTVTGAATTLYQYLTGYALSFGMEKVQLFSYIEPSDFVKTAADTTPFNDIYNKILPRSYSGYQADYPTGLINLYLNGVAQGTSGWSPTGEYIIVSGALDTDSAFADLKSGDKASFVITGSGFNLAYSGQELYLNGINLASGAQFVELGGNIFLRGDATGVTGDLSQIPIVLAPTTGTFSLWPRIPFQRDTSNVYFNGVRQQNYSLYIEGAAIDLLSGNSFNPGMCASLYANSNLYWT